MKVLEKGKRPQDALYHLRCGNCAALVEAAAKELELIIDQRDGNAWRLQCPECGGSTWFSTEALKNYKVNP